MNGIPHDLDLGALLAEQAFVRRLARSLVFDQDHVDDVVQQTYLAALRSPLRDPRAARPFLARVVHSVASNLARGERRRRRREAAAVPPDRAAPSVAEAFERESLRQQLVAELAELAEPYRTTLVLRFFADLEPHAIAARQGIPPATARTRLKRGLDLLRARVDARHGGDRRAWTLALLPLIQHGRPAGATATTGLMAFLATAKLWLAGGILLGAGILCWQLWPSTTMPPAADLTAAPPAVLVSDDGPGARAPTLDRARVAPAPAAPTPVAAARQAALRGRLVLPGGDPAPDRRVRLVGIDIARLFTDAADGVSLATDETVSRTDGTFAFAAVPPGALLALHGGVGSEHSAFAPVRQTPAPGATVDVGDVVLEARGSVVGRVEDEDGEGIAGADVWAADVPALITLAVNVERFDPAHGGMMALPMPSPGEDPGAFAMRLRGFLGSKFLMQPLADDGPLQVHVVDTPAWTKRLWEALPISRTRSRADGTFELRDVAPGVNLLVARKPGLDVALRPNLKVAAGTRTEAGGLLAGAGETLALQVVEAGGCPVADARVRVATIPLAGFRGLAFAEAEVRTDARGNAEVHGLPGGRVLLAARRGDDEPWTTIGPVSVQASARLVLPATDPLHVHFHMPVSAAAPTLVLRQGPAAGELARMGLLRTVELGGRLRAEPGGVVVIERLTPGTYVLAVHADGCAAREIPFTMPRRDPLEVALAAAVPPFEVLVTDDASAALAGARVYAEATEQQTLAHGVLPSYFGLPHWQRLPEDLGVTDARGRLRVEGRPHGAMRLWATHAEYGPATTTLDLPAPFAHLQLGRAAAVDGVIREKGMPVDPARWHVTIRAETKERAAPQPFVFAALEAGGRFSVTGLEPGLHRVEIRQASLGRLSLANLVELVREQVFSFGALFGDHVHVRDVVLAPGATRQLRIDLDPHHENRVAAHVFGRLLRDGRPVAGAQVVLVRRWRTDQTWISLPDDSLVHADAEGRFACDRLEEGRQELGFVDPATGEYLAVVEVLAQAGGSQELNLDLRTGTLAGRVVVPPGRSLIGARVTGEAQSGARLQAAVGPDGSFAVHGVVAGEWTLSADGIGLNSNGVRVTVAAGAAVRDLTLTTVAAVTLEVQVALGKTEDVFVSLRGLDGKFSFVRGVEEGKPCVFPNLRPGRYLVGPMDEEDAPVGEVDLRADGPAVQRVALGPDGVRRLD